ncbi:MAG: hypothetical protein HOP15_00910 [Planctomycetes bacterium]|nr:hypothetical protein [Planctomycetota bacterium]
MADNAAKVASVAAALLSRRTSPTSDQAYGVVVGREVQVPPPDRRYTRDVDTYTSCSDLVQRARTRPSTTAISQLVLRGTLEYASTTLSSVLFFALLFGGVAVSALLALFEIEGEFNALVVGVSYFLVTVAIARSEHEPITPPWFCVSSVLYT